MSFKIIHASFDKEAFAPIIFDGVVMNTFMSIESGPEPILVLRDKIVIGTQDQMIVRDFMSGWLLMLLVGSGAAAVPIAHVVVEHIEGITQPMKNLLGRPEVTIKTERKFYSDVDTSEPVGMQVSETKIASSLLNIWAIRVGNFEGSWAAQTRQHPPDFIVTPLDTLDDDPRDKKL